MTTWTLLAYPLRRGADQPSPVAMAEFARESEAFEAWDAYVRLADQRRLAVYGLPGPSWRMARSILSVRPTDHRDVVEACKGLAAVLAKGGGTQSATAAYKRWGLANGYVGNGGGWIYREGGESPVGQGWMETLRPRTDAPQYARVIRPGGLGMPFRVVERIVVPSLAEGLHRKVSA